MPVYGNEQRPSVSGFEVYFVAVGSSHYAAAKGRNQIAFPRIRGANRSARMMAEQLRQWGAISGVLLRSADEHLIDVSDIHRALERVIAGLRKDRPSRPLFVFYFAGHGLSEGVAWNHFSLPGTFVYAGNLAHLPLDQLPGETLHAAELVDRLNKAHVPYLVLLDTCYEGTAANFNSPVLARPAQQSLGDVARALRFMNEFHQGNAVLFSTEPGHTVSTVPDPTAPEAEAIGPIARRMILTLQRAQSRGQITLGELIAGLTSMDLDADTKPAVTHAQHSVDWDETLVATSPQGMIEMLSGTATGARVCCDSTAPAITQGEGERAAHRK